MSKPTPGPWVIRFSPSGYPYQISATDESLRHKPGGIFDITLWGALSMPGSAEGLANARLIAAAPELLVMLTKLRDRMAYYGIPNDSLPLWQEANALIHRVNGQELAE